MSKFKLSSFIEKRSPKWLKNQPWAVEAYNYIFKGREGEPVASPTRTLHPDITAFTTFGSSNKTGLIIVSHRRLLIDAKNDELNPILLKIDNLFEDSIISILKTRLIAAILKFEKDNEMGVLSVALLDDSVPYKDVIARAVTEIGFNCVPMSEYTQSYQPIDISKPLEMKVRNVIYHCGLHFNRKPTFLFTDKLNDDNIIWSIARYAEGTGNPIVIVDESRKFEKNYDKY
jgi:hypothetical protein